MSSTKWVWSIIGLVVIVGLLWWSGLFGNGQPATQTPTGGNNTTTTAAAGGENVSDKMIDSDIAAIDAQLKRATDGLSALSGTPSKVAVATVATNMQMSGALMSALVVKLQTRAVNAKTAGMNTTAILAALTDVGRQVSNGTSQAAAAGANANGASPTTVTLQQSVKQLQTARTDMTAARADIGVAMRGLGIK